MGFFLAQFSIWLSGVCSAGVGMDNVVFAFLLTPSLHQKLGVSRRHLPLLVFICMRRRLRPQKHFFDQCWASKVHRGRMLG